MKTKILAVILALIVMGGVASATVFAGGKNSSKPSALAYHDEWRKLWEDHIWWTRIVIISILDGLAGNDNYTARLLQNPVDMQNALAPYFGQSAATQFGNLVTQHLVEAAQILVMVKNGQNASTAIAAWYDNGNQIAADMNTLNPKFWPLVEAKAMWKAHLDATLQEAVSHFTGDFAGEVTAMNHIHDLALGMADFTSNGVIMEFPSMFTGNGAIGSM